VTPGQAFDPSQWNDGRSFLQGEVWLADDKHVSAILKGEMGLEIKQRRPVVVLQNDKLNAVPQMPVILVAPVTSQTRLREGEYFLKADGTLLERDSVIELSLIQPVPKRALAKKVGRLSDDDLRGVKDLLRRKFRL